MSRYHNYDCFQISFPTEGMVQNVAESVASSSSAFLLENIVPVPVGEGYVRYGTHKIYQWKQPPPDGLEPDPLWDEKYLQKKYMEIIGMFHYRPITLVTGPAPKDQLILYVNVPTRDEIAVGTDPYIGVKSVISDRKGGQTVRFVDIGGHKYEENERVIIRYSIGGVENDIVGHIKSIRASTDPTGNVNQNVIEFYDDVHIEFEGSVPAKVFYDVGTIYKYEPGSREDPVAIEAGFASNVIPRATVYCNKLFICNGHDNVRVWDGKDLKVLGEYIDDDDAKGFKREINERGGVNLKVLLFQRSSTADDIYKKGAKIKVTEKDGSNQELTIASVEAYRKDNRINYRITTNEDILILDVEKIAHWWTPPTFRYLAVLHNRLWALGNGKPNPVFTGDAYNVYCSVKAGEMNFYEKNGKPYTINVATNFPMPDVLEAIAYASGYTFFIGRNYTQVWQGSVPPNVPSEDPAVAAGEGEPGTNINKDAVDYGHTFVYSRVLPIGILHAELVINVSNELYVMNNSGMFCLSTYREGTVQLNVKKTNQIDNIITKHAKIAANNSIDYLKTRFLKYRTANMAGFRIGRNNMLCSFYGDALGQWSIFSGDFSRSLGHAEFNNALYIGFGNTIFKYGDGCDGTDVSWGDDGGDKYIHFIWGTQGIGEQKESYVNKHYELFMDYPSGFVLDDASYLNCNVYSSEPTATYMTGEYGAVNKGDILSDTPIDKLYLQQRYHPIIGRLRFLSRRFYVTLSGITKHGALRFKKLNLYGVLHRKSGAEQ